MRKFDPKIEYGRLTPQKILWRRPGNHEAMWECKCRCGNTSVVPQWWLLSGRTRSCGCLRNQLNRTRFVTHGKSGTREYCVWAAMIARCENENSQAYADYGGRGIKVCERWRASFTAFMEDMGPPPTTKHTVERTDNDKDYEPTNCVWGTKKEQGRNKRNNVMLTHNGKTQALSAWAEETGLPYTTIYARLQHGWSVDEALTKPIGSRKSKPEEEDETPK